MSCGVSSSLYDLSGNKIEKTYQRILQINGPGNVLYDGTGSAVTELTIAGSISGSFTGSGAGLVDLKKSWEWQATSKNNVTDQYLRRMNDIFTNVVPYRAPFNYKLTDIQAGNVGIETWDAEVHKNGVLVASASVIGSSSRSISNLNITASADDDISMYCNGVQIKSPVISTWWSEI